MAINSLISLPQDRKRRLWFVMDELAALKELKSLPQVLSEGGKYGACVVSAFQSIPSLYKIYDYNGAKALLNCFNTRVFFRNKDPETCNYISDSFGEEEIIEFQENHSYGAHEMRDGTNINYVHRMKKIVIPSEIIQLDDLHAFYQVPGNFPVAKIKFSFADEKAITDSHIPIQQKIEIFSSEELKQQHAGLLKPPITKALITTDTKDDNQESSELTLESSDPVALKPQDAVTKIIAGYIQDEFIIVKMNGKRTFKIPLRYYPALEKKELEEQNNMTLMDDRQSLYWRKLELTIWANEVLDLGEEI